MKKLVKGMLILVAVLAIVYVAIMTEFKVTVVDNEVSTTGIELVDSSANKAAKVVTDTIITNNYKVIFKTEMNDKVVYVTVKKGLF